MKKLLLVLFIFLGVSFAENLETIIAKAYENNPTLKQFSHISRSKLEKISGDKKWANPTIALAVNDIWVSEPTKRDLEPMQAQGIIFTQAIPTNSKLDIQERINTFSKNITDIELEEYKKEILSELTKLYYQYAVVVEKEKLLREYKNNIEDIKKYSLLLYKNRDLSQTEALKADIISSSLDIKLEDLKFLKEKIEIDIENLTYIEITSIDSKIETQLEAIIIDIDNHPAVAKLQKEIEIQFAKAKLADAKGVGDLKVSIGYFTREINDDYLSLTLAMPLGLYGKESKEVQSAMYNKSAIEDKLRGTKKAMRSKVQTLQKSIKRSLKNYETLKQKILPLKEHIQKILETKNSNSRGDSMMVLENISSTIELELTAIEQLSNYYESYSQLLYFKGNL